MPDITVIITIPEVYVSRLSAMVEGKFMHEQGNNQCDGLSVKQCFIKKMIIEPIKKELFEWERDKAATEAASAAMEGIEKIEINTT